MAKSKNPFEPGQKVKFVVLSTQEEKKGKIRRARYDCSLRSLQ